MSLVRDHTSGLETHVAELVSIDEITEDEATSYMLRIQALEDDLLREYGVDE